MIVGLFCGPCAVDLVGLGESLFEVYARDVTHKLIPYVGQLVLADVPVERGVFNPYEHGLHDGPGDGM